MSCRPETFAFPWKGISCRLVYERDCPFPGWLLSNIREMAPIG
jgi:hypothetical protein